LTLFTRVLGLFAKSSVIALTHSSLVILSILIGEIDEERDRATDLSSIRAEPIAPIRY
jgi:hypothetical protein